MSIFEPDKCQIYWGSHGCHLPRFHDGHHHCQDPDETQPHHTITRGGVDPTGFQWDMYGDDLILSLWGYPKAKREET
jgi:hypothetical protein